MKYNLNASCEVAFSVIYDTLDLAKFISGLQSFGIFLNPGSISGSERD
jgi:hypothetical protein